MELQISTLFSCTAGTLWVQKVQKHLEDGSKKSEYDTAVRDNATKNKIYSRMRENGWRTQLETIMEISEDRKWNLMKKSLKIKQEIRKENRINLAQDRPKQGNA